MKSYYRNCRNCGRRIQLRQMPAGHYVAYEGYDTIHDCNKIPERRKNDSQASKSTEVKPGYDDLGFIDVTVPDGGVTGSEVVTVKRKGTEIKPRKESSSKGKLTQKSLPPDDFKHAIDLAISDFHVLDISYVDSKGKRTIRDIEPLERDDQYLAAYCRKARAMRRFRISSIKSVSQKDETFEPKPYTESGNTVKGMRTIPPPTSDLRYNFNATPSPSFPEPGELKKTKSGIPPWLWIIAVLIAIFLLSRC